MKKIIAVLAVAVTVSAGAQDQKPSEAEVNARINILAGQRNQAQDSVVLLQARLAVVEAELSKLKKSCQPKDESKE